MLGIVTAVAAVSAMAVSKGPTLHFVAPQSIESGTRVVMSDLERVARERCGGTVTIVSYDSIDAALGAAGVGDGLAVLASLAPAIYGDPSANANHTTTLNSSHIASIQRLRLRVYWEFPRSIDAINLTSAGTSITTASLPLRQTLWERAVAVTPLGPTTAQNLSLLHPHKHVDFVVLPNSFAADLVLARVAGYDTALQGLPTVVYPLLGRPTEWLLVAATPLSNPRTRRFSPSARWQEVIARILRHVAPAANVPSSGLWEPSVAPSFPPNGTLPVGAEADAFSRGVGFFGMGGLMPSGEAATVFARVCASDPSSVPCTQFQQRASPFNFTGGRGQLGIFEGYTSDISLDGSQPMATGVRHDCINEVSASFALRAVLQQQRTNGTLAAADRAVATNLLNYGLIHGGFLQPWIPGGGPHLVQDRPWTVSGDAFGLGNFEQSDGADATFFKDGNARGILGGVATAGLLGGTRWHASLVANVLANLRATPVDGFGPTSAGFASLVGPAGVGTFGWRALYDAPGSPTFSPHYEGYLWACYLWAFSMSGHQPLYDRPATAIRIMMENYPSKWIPTSNGIAMQRARMILPLAFLVRVNDTAEHREWLAAMIEGYLTLAVCPADADWCAFREELSAPGWGGVTRVPNNADYGTFEAPLNQENNDSVSDFLYTVNFALLGLHEAAAATGNSTYARVEDKLVNYMVRAQARSTEHPTLDGAFFRGFDFDKWEAWGSDADIGWGAWSVETGWTQSWITAVLGYRLINTSLWQLGQQVESIREDFASMIEVMFDGPGAPPPPPAAPCIQRAPSQTKFNFTVVTDAAGLCCPSPGSNVSRIEYSGELCNGTKLLWLSMRNLAPKPGRTPSECEWSRTADPADIPRYLGWCGVSPSEVRLPTDVCS